LNAVFEAQLAFLEPFELQLIGVGRKVQMVNDVVQIPVFQTQLFQLCL